MMNANLPKDLEKLARSYQEACAVGCSLLHFKAPDDGGCRCCATLAACSGNPSDCAAVHRYGTYQAERFGGQYIYFCANSLLHWAVPYCAAGETHYVLIGGPALLVEPDEILGEIAHRHPELDGGRRQRIGEALRALPYLAPQRATALADLLFRLVREVQQRCEPASEQEDAFVADRWYPDALDSTHVAYPFDKEKDLLAFLAHGDEQNAQSLINDILGQVFLSSDRQIGTVRLRAHELLVLLSRAAVEGGASAEEVFGINHNWVQRLQQTKTIAEIENLLARVIRRFADCVFVLKKVKHTDIMHKAIRYIGQNYPQKISLGSVAAHVCLSPTYFSRLFKEEMQQSFVAYLNQIRIEKSKRLLADGGHALADVAGRVGFDDQSYFTRVFRQLTGMPPGEYRRQQPAKGRRA